NANRLLHGTLRRDGAQLSLQLHCWPDDGDLPPLALQAADAAGLLAAREAALPAWLARAGVDVHAAPPLPAGALVALGTAIERFDHGDAAAAAHALAALADNAPCLPCDA